MEKASENHEGDPLAMNDPLALDNSLDLDNSKALDNSLALQNWTIFNDDSGEKQWLPSDRDSGKMFSNTQNFYLLKIHLNLFEISN